MQFIITVDVEADNEWGDNPEASFENIAYLSRFQELCQKYNFPPTYLVTYEAAQNKKAQTILTEWFRQGKAEVGAHLHPWTTPPLKDLKKVFLTQLTREDLQAKLANLTEAIKNNFSVSPVSFRAGRWGINSLMTEVLTQAGYLADCSVTPKVDWQTGKEPFGPDYRSAPASPYFLSSQDVCQPGDSKLLEVPVTILYSGIFQRENSTLVNWFSKMPNGVARKIINKTFFNLTWCRIFSNTTIKRLKALYYSAVYNNLPVIEFMIHSSELMPGASPYAREEKDVEKIYDLLDNFFIFLQRNHVSGITLGEFAKNYGKINR